MSKRKYISGIGTPPSVGAWRGSKAPQGYWVDRGGIRRLGTGAWFPSLPMTLLDVLGVVEVWNAWK